MHADARGAFFEWFTDSEFTAFAGHRFDLHQANCSVSAAGMLRGVHFAQLPPSQAKYVTCPRGKVLDVIVDIRVGSPTFGRWDSVLLDDRDHRSVYISEGLGHAFLALEDDSTVMYLCSARLRPEREHTINALDPALDIVWPSVTADRSCRTGTARRRRWHEAEAAGLLPTWERRQAFIETRRRDSARRACAEIAISAIHDLPQLDV